MKSLGQGRTRLWRGQPLDHIPDILGEMWKKVPGLPTMYEVSNKGRIRRLAIIDARGWHRRAQLLKAPNAQLGLAGKWRALAALILRAFVGPPPKHCRLSRHLDDDRSNNCVENLAWGTDQDNINDALRNGRSFISYGHLGKPHSEETKAILRDKRKGIPTGHKMTQAHKDAIWAGYRKKFPIKEIPPRKPCACGCGRLAASGSSFIWGHAGRIRFLKINSDRIGKPRPW